MARLYKSRAILDPSFLQMRQQVDDAYLQRLQDQRNRLYDSLEKGVSGFGTLAAGAVGLGIDLYKKGKRRDQINQYKDEKAKQRASELDALKTKMANETDTTKLQELNNQYNNLQNMPLFDMSEIGAMNDYVENADSSKFLTLRQIKEAQQMRESDRVQKEAEAKALAERKFQLEKQKKEPDYLQLRKEYDAALAEGRNVDANIIKSKMNALNNEFGFEEGSLTDYFAAKEAEARAAADKKAAEELLTENSYNKSLEFRKLIRNAKNAADKDIIESNIEAAYKNGELTNEDRKKLHDMLAGTETQGEAITKATKGAVAGVAADDVKAKADEKKAAAKDEEVAKASTGTFASIKEAMNKINDLKKKYPDYKFIRNNLPDGTYSITWSKK